MKAYLEPDDILRLEATASCSRDRLIVRVLSRLGCRISEAIGLRVGDVDFTTGTVTIAHLKRRISLSRPSCQAALARSTKFCPSCGHTVTETIEKALERRRVRTLPLDKETLELLREHIEHGGPVEKKGVRFIFGINRHRAWQIVNACALKAGLTGLVNPDTGMARGISPHRLRDAFAVIAVKRDDSGDGLRLLQEHPGHVSFNTTARYRKVAGEEHRRWYEKLWQPSQTL